MPKQETVDKFFNSVTEAYDALLDAARSANDRGYRISRRLIDEIEHGQREALELSRRFALAPRDLAGFYASAVRTVTDAQGRTLELARQLLDEITDSQRQARDTLRRVIESNRNAGQAAITATREVVSRAGAAVENVRSRNGKAAPTSGGRKSAKTTSETSA